MSHSSYTQAIPSNDNEEKLLAVSFCNDHYELKGPWTYIPLKHAFQTDFPRRDSNMKVEVVMKYLAEKLGIARSHQVRTSIHHLESTIH